MKEIENEHTLSAGNSTMRWTMTVAMTLVLMTLVAGCGSAGDRLAGRWRCDLLGETAKAAPGGASTVAAADMLRGMGMKMDVEIEFKRDGTLNVATAAPMVGLSQGGGYWAVDEAKGDTLIVALRRAKEDEPTQSKVTFVDDDQFRLSSTREGGPSLTFTRVKEQ